MAEWLLEIFSTEIPARMQREAQKQLKSLAEEHLYEEGLSFESLQTFVTPRRLTLVVAGLPLRTSEKNEEKKGPRLDASPATLEGFFKTNKVKREDCIVRETSKGAFLFAVKNKPSQPTQNILSQIAPSLLERFRWPKSMRWGSLSSTWARPIRSFLSIFEGAIVPFSYAGIEASNQTRGHRFLAPKPFIVENFSDYKKKLREHFVILDWEIRRTLIQQEINLKAKEAHLIPLEDNALLDEVAGLVEWPVALQGIVDKHFMNLPLEVITTPMRVHQRYFPFVDSKGKLSPMFGIIANIETRDGGKTITRGNERVLRARLADAQFFWEQDQKKPLEYFNATLKTRVFHQHLGTLFDKVGRLISLSSQLAKKRNIDSRIVERAALLSKADLACQMVAEFPELQGIMGRYYAKNQGESSEVAQAIEEQYWPKISGGNIPEALPSLILALADRLDTLVGFFAIGITPTGSKDPFALRRAGLSLISLSLSPHFNLPLIDMLGSAYDAYPWLELAPPLLKSKEETISNLWQFLLERFKFVLKNGQGSAYDHVEAVLSVVEANPIFSDLSLRIKALDELMKKEDGQNLLNSYKRASNILKIEEEKEDRTYEGNVQEDLLNTTEEHTLFASLCTKSLEIQQVVKQGDFAAAVQILASLRPFVDKFFDRVVVNTEEEKVRANRLHLLAFLRKTMHYIADFSKLEGR